MKKEFFSQMLSKFETSKEVEILTDPQTRALKGGGCTCKKGGYVSCENGYSQGGGNSGGDTTTTIDPTIQVPKLGF